MRSFRRLPPLVRVASIAGLLYLLASIGLLITYLVTGWWTSGTPPHIIPLAVSPFYLGVACSLAEDFYRIGLPLPDRGLFWLDSWQSRVLATVLLFVPLPLCALVLALILPPTLLAFLVIYVICVLEGLIWVVASATVVFGTPPAGPMRTPPTG
jgi:hypothetical protein